MISSAHSASLTADGVAFTVTVTTVTVTTAPAAVDGDVAAVRAFVGDGELCLLYDGDVVVVGEAGKWEEGAEEELCSVVVVKRLH